MATFTQSKEFKSLIRAIKITWSNISADCEDTSNYEALQLCLDAGRLGMNGFKKEEEYFQALTQSEGYEAIFTHILNQVHLVY
jgi:hypothetical protein